MMEKLVEQLKKDEGFSSEAFWDNDQWTFGYGTKAPGKGATITKEAADRALRARISIAIGDFRILFRARMREIDEVRALALLNMLFNLGRTKLFKFHNMMSAVLIPEEINWYEVAYHASDSKWFKQVGKRAVRICNELATGLKYKE